MVNSLGEAALVFATSAGLCLSFGRPAIRFLTRAQCLAPVRYEDCPPLLAYQAAKQATPTLGGLLVLVVGTVAAAASGGLSHPEGWLILGAIAGLAAVGLCDDWLKFRRTNALGLRSLPKLLVAFAVGAGIGLAMAAVGPGRWGAVEIPWTGRTVQLGWGWIPWSMLVVAGSAHAVNLTDGMDGLAAGCVAIALAVFGIWAVVGGQTSAASWCAGLSGACVGFLWFNSFPASIFLGDVGALGLGAALGTVSLLTQTTLWLVVIGGVFVAEAVSVVLQVASYRLRNKRRIFRVAPLHHHFHLGGTSEPKLIVRFWIAGLILAMLGLTTREIP
jgi:phospho-N-acetylmuramoyl-pentapeptide-transferase